MKSPKRVELLGLGIAPVDFFVSMDKYPPCGLKIDGFPGSHIIVGGGPVPTALCTFSRLGGGRAALIAPLGDDTWADFARQELERFEIDHSRCVVRKNCPTALAFAWIEQATGARTIVLDSDPRLYIKPADLTLDRLPRPKLLHLDGRHIETAVKLARWGRKVGARVMLDIGSVRNQVDTLFPHIDFLVCADQYALHYFNTPSVIQAAFGFKKLGIPEVTITSGTAGAFGIDAHGLPAKQHAYKVETVDTTGAGDVFHGAYLYGISEGWPLAERLKFASAAAALKCLHQGARQGIPTCRQVVTFMKKQTEVYA